MLLVRTEASWRERLSCYSCPCHKIEVVGHQFHSSRRQPDRRKVVYKDPKVKEHNSNTISTHLPMTCLYQEKKQEIEVMRCKEDEWIVLVLYAAKIIKLQGRTKKILVQSCVKAFSDVGSSKPSDEYCDGMQEFFAFLQPNILTPSITPYTKIPTLIPMEFQEHAFANRTPLLSALFGLATGQSRVDKEKFLSRSFQDYQSQFLAVAVARDLLLCS